MRIDNASYSALAFISLILEASVLMRTTLVKLHRYAGLLMAGFLVVVGITGSLLAFYDDLDALTAPSMHKVQRSTSDAQLLDPFLLRERVQQAYPDTWVHFVPLKPEAGKTASFFLQGAVNPATGDEAKISVDQAFIDPYTGDITGERLWGDISEGVKNLMPFVYRLHYALAIPGEAGIMVLGVIALIWTIDCFTGVWLTFPPRRRRGTAFFTKPASTKPAPIKPFLVKQWWKRWQPSWKVRWSNGGYKLNFDLHRAGSLWLWAMLFIFAWSSVGFNLPEQVFRPVMASLFDYENVWENLPKRKTPQPEPGIPWREAHMHARALMAAEAARQSVRIFEEDQLSYDASNAIYRYRVFSDQDIGEDHGGTNLWFDANNGHLLAFETPTGMRNGNTVANWMFYLHMGSVFGLPYRIFVCIFGLFVVLVSITGVIIWLRKRRARRSMASKSKRITRQPWTPSANVEADVPKR